MINLVKIVGTQKQYTCVKLGDDSKVINRKRIRSTAFPQAFLNLLRAPAVSVAQENKIAKGLKTVDEVNEEILDFGYLDFLNRPLDTLGIMDSNLRGEVKVCTLINDSNKVSNLEFLEGINFLFNKLRDPVYFDRETKIYLIRKGTTLPRVMTKPLTLEDFEEVGE